MVNVGVQELIVGLWVHVSPPPARLKHRLLLRVPIERQVKPGWLAWIPS